MQESEKLNNDVTSESIMQVVETGFQAVKFLSVMVAVIAISVATVRIVDQLGFIALAALLFTGGFIWFVRFVVKEAGL